MLIPSRLTGFSYFLRTVGFDLHMSFIGMRIDLEGFVPTMFRELIDRLSSTGFVFKKLSDLGNIGEVLRFVEETSKDEPLGSGLETAETSIRESDLHASYAAEKKGEIVAVTLVKRLGSRSAYFIYTGTKRSYRGVGLAKAVKIHSLSELKRSGVKKAYTSNSGVNIPIIRVNTALGFKVVREHLAYVLKTGLKDH